MAVSTVAAYAFLLQVVLGSIVATQMATAAPIDAMALCAGGSHSPVDPAGKPATRLAHTTCMVCAFASLAPPLPEAAVVVLGAVPTARVHSDHSTSCRDVERYEPRSSRGPPQNT
jgi:hypothetical protein